MAAKFDSIKKLYVVAITAEERYRMCVAANIRMSGQLKYLKYLGDITYKILEMELKLGLRTPAGTFASNSEDVDGEENYDEGNETSEEKNMKLIQSYEDFRARVYANGGKGVNKPMSERVIKH